MLFKHLSNFYWIKPIKPSKRSTNFYFEPKQVKMFFYKTEEVKYIMYLYLCSPNINYKGIIWILNYNIPTPKAGPEQVR